MDPAGDPWDVAEAEFPANGAPADKLRFFLRYAVLAPSRHNTQPWRFEVRDNTVALYAFDAMTLQVLWNTQFPSIPKWMPPTIADGKVFMPTS